MVTTTTQTASRRAVEALMRAATLVAILGVVGLVACLAGIASPADLPWMLSGVFGGSFCVALVKQDARPR